MVLFAKDLESVYHELAAKVHGLSDRKDLRSCAKRTVV